MRPVRQYLHQLCVKIRIKKTHTHTTLVRMAWKCVLSALLAVVLGRGGIRQKLAAADAARTAAEITVETDLEISDGGKKSGVRKHRPSKQPESDNAGRSCARREQQRTIFGSGRTEFGI